MALCVSLSAADPTLTLVDAAKRTPPDSTPLYEGKVVVVSGQVSAKAIYIANYRHSLPIEERGHGLILETPGSMFRKVCSRRLGGSARADRAKVGYPGSSRFRESA